ncbi:kin of IRRE-like protein 1 [Mytilus edulis]|uniref:kin of IRRE-like protein 1 n=1 Tax=Mytilus edulis TaxID=6550 RepID=UPI0039EF230A
MPVIIFTFSVIVSAGYAQFVTKGNNQKDQVYCRIGEETVLFCPRGADDSSVTWLGPPNLIPYTDGKEINNDLRKSDRLEITGKHSSGEFYLQIVNITIEDEGLYRCSVIVNGSPREYDTELKIERLPTDLTITNMTNTHNIFSIEHTELILSCSVRRGNPVETLQWTRNGINIQNQNVSLSISKDNISEIAIIQYSFVSSREDNKDNFTCSAESSITEEPLSETVYLNVYYTPTVIAKVYPSNEIRESSDISLQCNADANPEVKKYTWQKHNRVLANVSVYNVTKIDRSQTGEYTCFGYNELGDGSYKINISVLYAPVINVTLIFFEKKFKLVCSPNGNPSRYRFDKWQHMSYFGQHIRYLNGSANGELIFPLNFSDQDRGIYKCKAENGILDTDGHLYQHGSAYFDSGGLPVFVDRNENVQYGLYHKIATLNLFITSIPKYDRLCCSTNQWKLCKKNHIHLFQERSAVFRDTAYGVNALVDGYQILFVTPPLESSDFTNYTFEAANSFGEAYFTIHLRDKGYNSNKTEPSASSGKSYLQYALLIVGFVIVLFVSHVCSWYFRTHYRKTVGTDGNLNEASASYNTQLGEHYEEINMSQEIETQLEKDTDRSFSCIAEYAAPVNDDKGEVDVLDEDIHCQQFATVVSRNQYEKLNKVQTDNNEHAYHGTRSSETFLKIF